MKTKKKNQNQRPQADRVTVINSRYEPSAIAVGMTVDRVHSILRMAENGDTRDLFCLYRDIMLADSHIQGEFHKRKLAVLGDAMSFMPSDDKSQPDKNAAIAVELMVKNCSSWLTGCSHLLDGSLWPVAVIEKVYAPSATGFMLSDLIPVPHHLQDYASGRLRIFDTNAEGVIQMSSHEADPTRYIVHRGHLLTASDNWGGPMRSILFWWLLSAMDREWWGRFLDRFGSPFPVGKYDRGDDQSRSVLERAFSLAVRVGGLVVTKETQVDLMQAAAGQTGEAYEKFLTICQREKSKLIIGQTLSAEAQPTGLGSGTSNMQEGVRQDIRKFDATMLTHTLRHQLFKQFLQANGESGNPPNLIFGSDTSDEVKSTIATLQGIATAGLEPADEAIPVLSARLGVQLRRRSAPLPGLFSSTFSCRSALPGRAVK